MPKSKRIKILNDPDIQDLYRAPLFSADQKRYFFILNDNEKKQINQKVLELLDYSSWRGHIHEKTLNQHLLKSENR